MEVFLPQNRNLFYGHLRFNLFIFGDHLENRKKISRLQFIFSPKSDARNFKFIPFSKAHNIKRVENGWEASKTDAFGIRNASFMS